MSARGRDDKSASWLLRAVLVLLLTLITANAWARGFIVQHAGTRLVDGVYLMDADIQLGLSEPNLQAMRSGIALTIEMEIAVMEPRDWLWDREIAGLRQRYRLEFHALAGQFVVTNLNSGELRSFPTLGTATDAVGRVRDLPLLDESLLEPGLDYYARLRVRLDIEALPAPLRPVAYFSSDWRLASNWYRWPL